MRYTLAGALVGFMFAGGYGLTRMMLHAARHEGDLAWLAGR